MTENVHQLADTAEKFMADHIRGVLPKNLSAAISCVLYAEEKNSVAGKVDKLQDAMKWIVQEIVNVDPRAGLRVQAQMEMLKRTMAGENEEVEAEVRIIENRPSTVSSEDWDRRHEGGHSRGEDWEELMRQEEARVIQEREEKQSTVAEPLFPHPDAE